MTWGNDEDGCQPGKTKQLEGFGPSQAGIVSTMWRQAREGGGSVKVDQVPRGKLWSAIKSVSSCFGQAGEDIALCCLIREDVHPYRINDCDDPVFSRARQLNRDFVEVPRASDRNVVNVASSIVTAPLIKSGPCSGKRGALARLVWAKSTLWRSRRAPNQ